MKRHNVSTVIQSNLPWVCSMKERFVYMYCDLILNYCRLLRFLAIGDMNTGLDHHNNRQGAHAGIIRSYNVLFLFLHL